MNLHNNLLIIIIFITIYNRTIVIGSNPDLMVRNKGVDMVRPCSNGLVFYVDVNNISDDDFDVELTPARCSLGEDDDCDVLEVIGACLEKIPQGTRKILKAMAPLLDPFRRTGDCIFYLDSKPSNGNTEAMRDKVKVTFDTRLNNKNQPMLVPNNFKPCNKTDENPFNNCNSVDCHTYHNGKRSYFDKKLNKCVEVPSCVTKRNTDLPSVYDSINNKCVTEQLVTNDDLDFIKELTDNNRRAKDILVKGQSYKEDDFVVNTTKVIDKKANEYPKDCVKKSIVKYVSANKWTVSVFGGVILVQCCLICTMIYFLTRNCSCFNEKKVIRKFFNYRQDASMTTPLIGTTNNDTGTNDFNYDSDFTNINKLKCYKACQKETQSNEKKSLSDDILSKCIARRDWNRKPVKSQAIAEVMNIEKMKQTNNDEEKCYQIETNDKLKSLETKINLEKEVSSKISYNQNELNEIITNKSKNIEYEKVNKKDSKETQCDSSEKEIRCHSYNFMGQNSDVAGFYPSAHTQILEFNVSNPKRKNTTSLSTEKSVQAAFSNDSLDDFLSERGLIFLAGENLSKYSYSSASNAVKKSASTASNKTSKNNIIKNVLSLLHRRSKQGPLSDPGINNVRPLDMELLHMSHASINSSSNNGLDCIKGLKKVND